MDSSNNSDKVLQKDIGGEAGALASVLVVGAGPTGLLLASELERRGGRFIIGRFVSCRVARERKQA
jgi:NADPH-dependent 2,4-dienoyl-CoA reductase/sulfur reductase-like enzyme